MSGKLSWSNKERVLCIEWNTQALWRYILLIGHSKFLLTFPNPLPALCFLPTLDCRFTRTGTILLFLVSSVMPHMAPVYNDYSLSACLVNIMRLKELVSSRYTIQWFFPLLFLFSHLCFSYLFVFSIRIRSTTWFCCWLMPILFCSTKGQSDILHRYTTSV